METTLSSLVGAMKACEQAPGLSVLRHGLMVRDYYADLVGHLRDGKILEHSWRLPDWTADPLLVEGLPPDDLMARYHVFHDCGKPSVLITNADGRRHFPGHAEASSRLWLAAGGCPEVAALIAMDMDVHLLKDAGVPDFAARPQARALLLTGIAEVHANATLFGGFESTSFKIKWKHIDRRGRAILRHIAEEKTTCTTAPLRP